MAHFSGFKCDKCDAVMDRAEVTKVTVKFDGPEVSGEFSHDLCEICAKEEVPPGVTMRPLRRRRTRDEGGQSQQQDPQHQPEPSTTA